MKNFAGFLTLSLPVIAILMSFFVPQTFAQTVYTYTIDGPYYDDGGVANADVGVAVQWVNGTVYRFVLSGNGTHTNSSSIVSTNKPFQILWNASSALNLTRVYDFLPTETSGNVSLYIPSPEVPAGYYYFTIGDFYGMTNPYLQTALSFDGSSYNAVERRNLNSSNTVSFVMAQYGTYLLSFVCDEGTYSQSFTAENSLYVSLPVLAGAFPVSNSSYPVAYMQRINSTAVGITYNDPMNATNWLYCYIYHRQGTTFIHDYFSNTTGNSQYVIWNDGDADKQYYAIINASRTSGILTWKLTAILASDSNPWYGVFDFLGNYTRTLPFYHTGFPAGMSSDNIAQILAGAFVIAALSIGSFKSAGLACGLAWIIGLIFWWRGWWAPSIPLFGLGAFLIAFILIDEAKNSVREF